MPLLNNFVAAISVGMVEGSPLLDLNYGEDSSAQTDMNVVMTDLGEMIEIQGTAEKHPLSCNQLMALVSLAKKGIDQLIQAQQKVLGFSTPF